jgi:hypothetical protein
MPKPGFSSLPNSLLAPSAGWYRLGTPAARVPIRLLATETSKPDPEKVKQAMKDTEDLAWPRESKDDSVSRKMVEKISQAPEWVGQRGIGRETPNKFSCLA